MSTAGVFAAAIESVTREQLDLTKDLGRVSAQTWVVHGDYDHIPVEYARRVAQAIPNARFEVIESCGHFPWVEQPETFVPKLEAFLSD